MTGWKPFEHQFAVGAEDIDFMGHANNSRYLEWVQRAVLAHWHSLAPEEVTRSYVWIAVRHEIQYFRPAFINENLSALLEITRLAGVKAEYTTLIRRAGEVLADVKSVWCCLSADTFRPVRIPLTKLAD